MINLKMVDRHQLLALLVKVPVLGNYRGRRQVLENAGLAQLIPLIDLEGPSYVVLSEIVSSLSTYGHVAYEHEALGQFVNVIKEQCVGKEEQEFLDRLLVEYDLMVPVTPSTEISKWLGSDDTQEIQEKIIGKNTLRPIAFLQRGFEVGLSVAFINVAGKRAGTGFLISPDLLITNHHVLPSNNELKETIFRFNYQLDFAGHAQSPTDYNALPNGLYENDANLDYAVVQLAGRPGDQWGWLSFQPLSISQGERVNIIQHPAAQPKQVSIQNNFVEYVDKQIVQYLTSTLPGSSGSPVFNDQWQVVAIHHAGGMLTEPTTGQGHFRNEGTRVSSILNNLTESTRELIQNSIETI